MFRWDGRRETIEAFLAANDVELVNSHNLSVDFRLYRAGFPVRADRNDGRGRLSFGTIAGKAEVWVDGVKLGEKTTADPAPFAVLLPKGPARRELTVLVQAQPGQPAGILGRVVVEAAPQ